MAVLREKTQAGNRLADKAGLEKVEADAQYDDHEYDDDGFCSHKGRIMNNEL